MELPVRGRALLAPISSFSNLPFRLLCQRHGAQGTVVPLVSAKAIVMHGLDMAELDPGIEEEFPGVQLFGSSGDDIGKAAAIVHRRYDFIRYIDINCACPVQKVVRNGAGASMLKKPEAASAAIRAAAQTGLPVTVKLRKLPDDGATLAFCRICESAGASALFVHGRLPSQGYSGGVDWEIVSKIARSVSIPVIGSGDIRSMEAGKKRMEESGCAGFMIGRAAMSDPGIFSSPGSATPERKRALFSEYLSLCGKHSCLKLSDLKSKAIQFFSGFDNSSAFRARIGLSKSVEELLETVG